MTTEITRAAADKVGPTKWGRQSGGCDMPLAVMTCITHLKHTTGSIITVGRYL
jgi:hypothetical protein